MHEQLLCVIAILHLVRGAGGDVHAIARAQVIDAAFDEHTSRAFYNRYRFAEGVNMVGKYRGRLKACNTRTESGRSTGARDERLQLHTTERIGDLLPGTRRNNLLPDHAR